jgi:uncharacterized protein (TIGR00297 family)
MPFSEYFIYFLLLAGVVLSILTGKLTASAALLGGIIGLLIFKGGGYAGITMLALFFILGSGATGWKLKKKQEIGIAEKNKGRRTIGQVMANGGLAAILGGIAWYKPDQAHTLQLMMAGCLAAATADTLSSELGTLLGRRFYNVITFKNDQPGLDGVVSMEGTLIGIAGASLIASIYCFSSGWNIEWLWIILAGAVGNLVDSLLGATLERRHMIGNNIVNFLNTLTGALVCLLLLKIT